ncbi:MULTISPECIES: alpha/beta fold hydrolase [Nocardiopsis]|uniref:Alpha/beta hydrolase n=1 Tax=Nocardiopsis sinuspersici TaxID=501010 RepID=A0A1V3BYV6_9ACTN|nr:MULTISPECIES: alpha/beta hydrolase [Nocardiopsis]OOC53320.1 alpha/beta hydrolase [Nocardiopsis sinuspersici]
MSHHEPETHTLKVPGAKLYYEVRGSGPVLLLIPGGPQDAGVYDGIAERLADHYTTVSYDPRGNSRSPLDGEPEEQRVDLHGDDAALLISEVGIPAYVFGNSAGAHVGLDLVTRHPTLVRELVAHEPPCLTMLDDPSEMMAGGKDVYDTYLRGGAGAAMGKFLELNGLDGGSEPEGGSTPADNPWHEDPETYERVSGNFDYFFSHGLMPLSLYEPDVEALRTSGVPVTVGLGEADAGKAIYDMGLALALRLDTDPVAFPGDHLGFGPHPEAFADTLHRVLDGG